MPVGVCLFGTACQKRRKPAFLVAIDLEPVLSESQPLPSEERIFNAPLVAVLLTASIPLLNLLQQWVARSDPFLIVSLAFRPSSLMQDWGWPGVLTSMFLHAGWMHAGMNTLGALAFGPPIARQMVGARGAMAFLLFYIACGLVATIGYGLIHIQSDDLLVGASGAIFGLTGAALRLLGRKCGRLRSLQDRRFLVPAAVLMGVNALLGLSGLAPGMEAAQIAWEAHAFGFVGGCLLIGPWVAMFGDRRKRFDSTVDLRDPSI